VEIIPVIDLLQGQVVRARHGERHLYRPIVSQLCSGSDPLAIVSALLKLYPFKSLYIADLDAIQGQGNHHAIIVALREQHPELRILLDAGLQRSADIVPWHRLALDFVIGSERIDSIEQYAEIMQTLDPSRTLLSLDFGKNGFIGSPDILSEKTFWPDRIIAMTLTRVGSQGGPDIPLLQDLMQGSDRQIIAAGGVRHQQDLKLLKKIRVSGVLIASALHDGHITAGQLADLNQ
jgi:phosphoribosylformimino-5-aminoimidazole carboxamide ribotide isomerase